MQQDQNFFEKNKIRMNIVWIIDNKYRDLYGVNSLKNYLKKNINLMLINKYHWKYAISLFDPHYVVLPNIYENSGLSILKFCIKNKIKAILYNVEGFHLDKYSLEVYFPKKYIKFLHKIFVWCLKKIFNFSWLSKKQNYSYKFIEISK